VVVASCYSLSLARSHATAGTVANLLVHSVDSFGVQLSSGGDDFYAELLFYDVFKKVDGVDRNDGTYLLPYTLTRAGAYAVSVMSGGTTHISGSPFAVKVARDAFSNVAKYLGGYDGVFGATLKGPTPVAATMTDVQPDGRS
ncbi:hypothetical protein T484DRAFT_1859069, partial [Baffinella frigidus]